MWSNRGNNLIFSVLEKRYPGLCDKASLEMVETLLRLLRLLLTLDLVLGCVGGGPPRSVLSQVA